MLTGAGGSGKTRLALEVAGGVVAAYGAGVWLVELAPLSDPALVPQAVATALGVVASSQRPLTEVLLDYLRPKQLLLLLDNCEHLLAAAAQLTKTLLQACPQLRILATSREVLHVTGEVSWLVPPLSLPDPQQLPLVAELPQYEAVRLFVERACARQLAFAVTDQNAQAVVEICVRLAGIPLAIELAAARIGVLSTEQIAVRLGDALRLLTDGDRTAATRQQTLRGTLDWSYQLLSKAERQLFARLSVFAGGWSLAAAEVVGAGAGVESAEVLELLAHLVDKSLVVAGTGAAGAARYRLLEPVRQYAAEQLAARGEAEALRRQHARYFLALVEAAERQLHRAEQLVWLERLETEHDNLRAALAWVQERDTELGLRLAGTLWRFWLRRGYVREGRAWLESMLAKDNTASRARARALWAAGSFAFDQGDSPQAVLFSESCLALARELEDTPSRAGALLTLGYIANDQGNVERATALWEESLTLAREVGDPLIITLTLIELANLAVRRGDLACEAALLEESYALARTSGDTWGLGRSLESLGDLAIIKAASTASSSL